MKKNILTALLLLTMLLSTAACTSNSGSANPESADSTTHTASQPSVNASDTAVSATDTSSAGESSPSADETASSTPVLEEATFNSTKDYTDTIVQRYVDVSKLSDKTKENVVDIFNGNPFSADITGTVQLAKGLTTQFAAVMAKNGEQRYFRTEIAGQTTVLLQNAEGAYRLDEGTKTAVPFSVEEQGGTSAFYSNQGAVEMFTRVIAAFGQEPLTYVRNSLATYEGNTCLCEEYAVGDAPIKLYYDGDTVKGMTLSKGDFVVNVTVNHLTASADAALFQLPQGYTVSESSKP